MPMIEFSDEEVQQLTLVLANASGPGVSWMLTNNLLTKLQAQAKPKPPDFSEAAVLKARRRHVPPGDGLDLVEPPVS